MSTPNAPLTPARIMQMTWGFAAPLTLEAAIRHRVFDVLDGGPKTLDELAKETGASKRGLRAIANTLVGIALLGKEGERYSLTPESSAFLVSHKPGFQGGLLRHVSAQLVPSWLKLSEIVASGKPALAVNQQGTGTEFFGDFVESIAPMSAGPAAILADHLFPNLAGPAKVLDLAAGSGVWGIAMAKKSPHITVSAVDWAGVILVTRRCAQKQGVVDRFNFIEGDLNSADFGQGYSAATLGHILHSEGETKSRALLKKVFAALKPGGTIAIAEFVADDDRKGPVVSLIFAINMLVNTEEGDTFTLSEISRWLSDAGFKNIRQLAAPGPSPLILADKPGV